MPPNSPAAKASKIGVCGAAGRMGKMLVQQIVRTNNVQFSGATVNENDPCRGRDAGEPAGVGRTGVLLRASAVEMFEDCDVVIDFTSPSSSLEHCMLAHEYKTALVIGTTGFNPAQVRMLQEHARSVPIVASPNMSFGVNILIALTEHVSRLLDADYDIEIFEMHHRHKVDAPSGTALALGRAAASGRKGNWDDSAVWSRHGQIGEREEGTIGFSVARGGDVIGDHTVYFAGEGERLELTHRATDRAIYARGAVKAAQWLKGRPPGLYTMRNVLGFN